MELAPNTIRQHFKVVAGVFKWAKLEGKGTIDNPTLGLAPKGEENTREAFLPADLEKLFRSPLFTGHWRLDRRERPGHHLAKDSKYWLPLIALHSGLRVEEIAKLKTRDVREIDGVWCFDIYGAKTDAGTRHVPVHPRLVSLGLIEYAQRRGAEQLWPELVPGSEGKYSQRFCQWWSGFRHLIGVDRDGLVFHSFRHTFAGALQQAGVQEAMVALIMGHRHPQLTFGRYGGKLITPRDKLEVFAGIDFGVSLEHLRAAPSQEAA
jgi:integrase